MTALAVEELVQFTAGMAYELARACSRSFMRLSPVTTPEGTMSAREVIFVDFYFISQLNWRRTKKSLISPQSEKEGKKYSKEPNKNKREVF